MQPKLSFGFLCDFRNPARFERNWSQVYAETLDFIAHTETLGYQGAWVPEHHAADDGYIPSPLVTLGAIAARTKTLRIGSAVALAPLYHPVRFAEDCAVLDLLADGRVEMALAIGYRKRETAGYGVDFTKRGKIFDEFLEIVTRLWAGETVTYAGQHFQIENARIVPRPARTHPLYIGGFAPKALERVAKYADGYFGNEEFWEPYAQQLEAQGKPRAEGRVRIQALFSIVADDPGRAMEELAPYYHHANNMYGVWLNEDKAIGIDDPGLKPMDLEAFKTSGILQIMTPAEAIDHYKAMRGRTPVDHVMMMLPPGLPAERFVPYAELFAREVIPAFA